MPAERITLHRTNVDKTELIEQYPKTITGQVYDFNNGKFLNETLNDVSQQLVQVANEAMDALNETERLDLQKADVSYVNRQIQAANTAYKESYATLTDLQNAYPNGDVFNHVVLADNMIYTWLNNAWVNTQIQANGTGIPNNSVTPDKTTFLENDTNLFKGDVINKDLFDGEGRFVISNAPSFRTAIIQIQPNKQYSVIKSNSNRFKIATDTIPNREENVILQGSIQRLIPSASGINYFNFRSGANDHYLYVNYTSSGESVILQVVEGTVTDFVNEVYNPSDDLNIYNKEEVDEKIANLKISPQKTTFLKRANLYDGEFIRKTLTGNLESGYTLDNSSTGRVAKIEIQPNKEYTVIRQPSSRFKLATDTITDRTSGLISGVVKIFNAGASDVYKETFKTGADDVVLYVDYSNTDEDIYLEIIEGVASNFTTTSYEDVIPTPDLLIYTKREIDKKLPIKNPLKLLLIGNSFSVDSTQFLNKIAASAGIEVLVGCAYDSGQSLQGHWNKIQNTQGITSYYKWSIDGVFTSQENALVADIILDEDWDIITFQQVSSTSQDYTTYQPFLNNLINYTRNRATNSNVKIGMLMTWAYSSRYQSTNQAEMYNNIVNAYTQAIKEQDLDILIPTATSFQNARSHVDLLAVGNELTRDGYHANYGIGRFICALTVFETLLAKRHGKDIFEDVTFYPKKLDDNNITDGVDSSKYLAYLAKIAVRNAVINPFKVIAIK